MESKEFENLRLIIMAEVNDKLHETNRQFDDIIRDLEREGTEFSRGLQVEIENINKNLKRVQNQVDQAVKMSGDSAVCTSEANKAAINSAKSADETRIYVRTNIFVTAITFLGILITVVTFGISYNSKIHEDTINQKKMIYALQEKITQDAANQQETVAMMKQLYDRLGNGK
jgi:hypothetical protein